MANTLNKSYGGDNPMIMLFKGIARQAWLAGLGIVSKAQQEGSELFESFIEEGARVEALAQANPDHDKRVPASDPVSLEKLEHIFDERVLRSIQRLNVPTQEDMKAVYRQMEALKRNLQVLTEQARPKS